MDQPAFEAVLAASDKTFGKSPEAGFLELSAAIPQISSFSLGPYVATKLQAPLLTHAKSPKADVRAAAVAFAAVVVAKLDQDVEAGAQAKEALLDEMLGAIKAGKTANADHRMSLYAMIRHFPASAAAATKVITVLPLQIPKETTSEAALASLLQTLSINLAVALAANVAVPAPSLAALKKELASPKAVARRAVVACLGDALWTLGESSDEWTEQADQFAEAMAKILADVSLKTVATNALAATVAVGEGFVAAAVFLGPLSKSKSAVITSLLASDPILQGITATTPKPSFLLWDKAQRRTTSAEEEVWLLRGLQAFISRFDDKLAKDEALRIRLGLSFIFLSFTSKYASVRRDALLGLRASLQLKPKATSRVIRDALKAWLLQRELKPAEETPKAADARSKQLVRVLNVAASFPADTPEQVRDDGLADLLILAHHSDLGEYAKTSFVDILAAKGVDAAKLVERTEMRLVKLFSEATAVPVKSVAFAEAAYRAARTLTVISPNAVMQQFLATARSDLDPQHLAFIGAQELGIWSTPEGSLFVDVLAKKAAPAPAADRNNALDKWEKEVRESAAKKKAATAGGVLSKADQALVAQQTKVEADVRAKMQTVKEQMARGLAIIRSLIAADVEPFKANLTEVLQLIMDGPLDQGSFLVSEDAFNTFLLLGDCCAPRLESLRQDIGVAILRNYGTSGIPEQYNEEPLDALLLRVLYRLRTLSETSPFDSTTYAYITMLLTTVVAKGATGGLAASEEVTEQLALVLEIMDYHCGEFGDSSFPRLSTITDLILLIGTQPLLRKSAASALIDLGQAIELNATLDELQALLKGTLSQEVVVRNASLQALQPLDLTDFDYSSEIWIAVHDEDAQNARLAHSIWEDNGLDVPDTFISKLLPFLEHDNAYVRNSCAIAIGEAVRLHPELLGEINVALEELYIAKAKILAPEFDEYGMVREESLNRTDPWQIRLAIADTFRALGPIFNSNLLIPFFSFLIDSEALGDRSAAVRRGMLDAGSMVIDLLGQTRLTELIAVFEAYLAQPSSGTEAGDHISEAIVILFGRIAGFLEASDPRVPKVVDRLVQALKTPSEVVQAAVSDCIPALVKRMRKELAPLVDRLFEMLVRGEKYAERRGAAYGIAGVVKGRGLSALKEFGLMDKLDAAAKDKESYPARQGALLAFETLSAALGRVFEPYVENILPLLLQSFGDTVTDVRDSCQDASKVIMSRLSGHCVNIILPSLLAGLEEKQWRTKKGSIELLGAMAFCAPKQLAKSLPTIIPELTAVLTDSHTQVRQSANTSLKRFGDVIHNPEIKALVPTLLKALVDPTGKTNAALTHLLNTAFSHFIDAPSLALVTPIIERGMRERSAQSKRKSVQILGNLSSLTDPKDFTPYLSTFMPLVHIVLVDPVPEARGTAAKALGTLVERLGEDCFPDLVESLLDTLRSDTSGVDRQGAAQGLSEVLSGLGMERLEGLLPEIISNSSSPRHYVREGFISLLVYLPTTFGHRFSPHLGSIIPPILGGLADESEYVRDASMRAGKMIIGNYSAKAVDLLLPELLKGMTDEKWRIRQSSVSLTGELLFKISGISGKAEIEVEDGVETSAGDSSRKALTEALGAETRDRVLSALYVIRQDAVGAVRTASLHIWKALVQNTPRTLREILPSVINMVIALLSSPGAEQKETASRTLGELCKKNGERIIAEMIPMLQSSVVSEDPNVRIGACLAFSEMLDSATELQLEEHQDAIIAGVRTALVDESTAVRAAAAQSFDVLLQSEFGTKAIDQTIPTLLEALRQPGAQSETALRALREIMAVRANSIFPVVLPALIGGQMSAFNARALGSLVSVAGSALSRRLTAVLQALVKSIETDGDDEIQTEVAQTMRVLLQSIEDIEGLNTLMMTLLGWAKGDAPRRRVSALGCFQTFCEVTEEDFSEYRVDWIRQLISAFADRDDTVVEAAWLALEAMVKTVPKDELENLVVPLRTSIESTAAAGVEVPGFSRPKGVQSIVPILLAGVLGGTHDQREQAALGVGDLVLRTSEAGIKPYIVQLTGPLIRVISSQAFPPAIKNAILGTLTVLLRRVPHLVRPFQPQLQRTFVKSVSDPASISIRNHAAEGLGVLMVSQARVDPLITELVTAVRSSEPEIAASLVHALACVAHTASKNMSPASKALVEELVAEAFQSPGLEPYNDAIARVVSGLALNDPQDVLTILQTLVFPSRPAVLTSMVLLHLVAEVPSVLEALDIKAPVVKQVLDCCSVFDNPSVARPARETRELLKEMHDETLDALLAN